MRYDIFKVNDVVFTRFPGTEWMPCNDVEHAKRQCEEHGLGVLLSAFR